MAKPPAEQLQIVDQFGPHLAFSRGSRLDTGVEPDRLVKTHCCFCGQQCGIQLKVKDNEVIGFEPWEEFPFNKGMLCPKGVKRYLQGAHPDRLTTALRRDVNADGGFSAMPYDHAIRQTAEAIQRVQAEHGHDAMAMLSGASLTTEKTYLMGKFARLGLKTANIDYNGRLCMVSAAGGNKKAFGIDRAASPWNDMLGADVVWISGANVAECAPITTNYVWQARENGAKIIVVDPRITPIARTCDLFLPVKPGRDVALFAGILHLMIENDWLDHDFIENHTVGFDAVAASVKEWTPQRTAEVTGIAERLVRQAAEWWGQAKTSFLTHARGIEHHSHGVQNVLGAINIVLASGRIGRPNCGYATITGQANGQGGREHGQKCDQLPGARQVVYQEGSGNASVINLYVEGGKVHVGMWSRDVENWDGMWLSTSIEAGKWHHVVMVLDDAKPGELTECFRVYVDGERVGEGKAVLNRPHWVRLGGGWSSRFPGHDMVEKTPSLRGWVDDFIVYRNPLTDADVQQLYQRQRPER